jgi:hypothetical protein
VKPTATVEIFSPVTEKAIGRAPAAMVEETRRARCAIADCPVLPDHFTAQENIAPRRPQGSIPDRDDPALAVGTVLSGGPGTTAKPTAMTSNKCLDFRNFHCKVAGKESTMTDLTPPKDYEAVIQLIHDRHDDMSKT